MVRHILGVIFALASFTSAETLFFENFSNGDLTGWTLEPGEFGQRWIISSQHYFDAPYGVICEKGSDQDERLISPPIHLTSEVVIRFHWATSYTWFVSPHNNGDYLLEIREAGEPGDWVEIWNEETEGPFNNWTWYETKIGIGGFWDGHDVQFAWRIVADRAADAWLDTITVYDGGSSDIQETSFGVIKATFR
ncbi:choice-of-anchor J domain-containing protein [bacterium]|nr:choice-of-anchor J domain-containing protein [bacterium]